MSDEPTGGAEAYYRRENARLRARVRELEKRPHEEVKARVLAHWDYPLGWEHGAYVALPVEEVMAIRKRNNVERPSFYGARIQDLTSTALFLYSVLNDPAPAGGDGS